MRPRAAALTALLVGCGGAAGGEPPASPAAEPSPMATTPEPATIEEAQAELERARVTLRGTSRAPSQPAAGGAPVTPVTPSPATPQSAAGASASADTAGDSTASACGAACKAMTSMRRAKDAICRLAGKDDPRCVEAVKKVADGEALVASCACPAVNPSR